MDQLWRSFGKLVPIFILIVLVSSLALFFIWKRRKGEFGYLLKKYMVFLAIIEILLITIFPTALGMPKMKPSLNLTPFVGMYDEVVYGVDMMVAIRNILFNILLFMPFGFFLSLANISKYKNIRNVTLTGMILSISVEFIQYIFPMGRVSDIDDVILNTIGTLIGCLIVVTINALLTKLYGRDRKEKGTSSVF